MKIIVRDPLEFDVLATGVGFTEVPVVTDDGTVLDQAVRRSGISRD